MTQAIYVFLISSLSLYLPLILFHLFSQNSADINSLLNQYLYWDSGWYIRIANQGYPECFNCQLTYDHLVYAWPPLYPLILRTLNKIFNNYGITIFLLQNALVFVSIFMFQKITTILLPKIKSWSILLIYFLFPMSLFLFSGYTETIFTTLTLTFVYLLITKKYLASVIIASLSPLIRFHGVLYILLLNYFFIKSKLKPIKIILLNIIFVLPLTLWIYWVYQKTNNIFFIQSVINSDLAIREWHKFSGNIFLNFIDWIKILFGNIPKQFDLRLQGFFLIFYLFLNYRLFNLYKKTKNHIFAALALFGIFFSLFPLQTGVESIARYGYAFPFTFLGLYGLEKNQKLFTLILIISLSLRIIMSLMFYLHFHIT